MTHTEHWPKKFVHFMTVSNDMTKIIETESTQSFKTDVRIERRWL